MAELPAGATRNSDGSISYRGYQFPGLNKPVKSKSKNKKYVVLASKDGVAKIIHFGDSNYSHNHSQSAKESYLARSSGIKDKSGNSTANDPHHANYWARKVLWSRSKPADGSAKTDSCKVESVLHEFPIPQLRLTGHSDSYIQGYRTILQKE